jgi:hypothetical protein
MPYGQILTDSITDSSGGVLAPSSSVFRNRILNGAMQIDQRNAGAAVNPAVDQGYIVDRWLTTSSAASKFSAQQNAGAVTPPVGFVNYLGATSLSAYSVGAAEGFTLSQRVEGLNIADLAWGTANAATVTLSFWVRSSLTGTFGGSLTNSAFNRSYPFTYTINSANTWEKETITITGDTSGTWVSTNGIGIRIHFSLGSGSSLSGTAGAWTGSGLLSATGATSVVGTNGATFYITGVQLEKGSTATSFDYRPYGTELALCQRYYYKIQATVGDQTFSTGYNSGTTNSNQIIPFPVSMRVAPSALEQSGTAGNYKVLHGVTETTCSSVPTYATSSQWNALVQFPVVSGLTAGQGSFARSVNTSAYLGWSAEL